MPKKFRVFVSRVRHEGEIVEPEPGTVVRPGDVVAVITRTELLIARGAEIGPEVNDKPLLDFPQEFLDAVMTNKALGGKNLPRASGHRICPRGLPPEKPSCGEQIPFTAETRIDRGDLLSFVGAKQDVERAAKELGYAAGQ